MKKIGSKWKYILLILAILVFAGSVVYKLHMDNSHKPLGEIERPDKEKYDTKISDNLIYVRNRAQRQEDEMDGIIFLGTSRVDPKCYLPLMIKVAEAGYDCFLPLAHGIQPSAATELPDSVIRKYTSIDNWYIAGHSDSCSQAAAYIKSEDEFINALIYLGGASNVDISDEDIHLLSIRGSNDTVFDEKRIEDAKKNDPKDTEYKTIKGGNNSGFVYTDLLEKDSKADISFEEQIEKSAAIIDDFISKNEE